MPAAEKPSWPKTEGGTTDWEQVFEAPETGLIPLILQAKSASTLRRSTITVIEMLYTRKDDPPEVARFRDELEAMIPDALPAAALPRIAEAVSAILRQIKEERVRRAIEYLEAKLREEAAEQDAADAADGIEAAAERRRNRKAGQEFHFRRQKELAARKRAKTRQTAVVLGVLFVLVGVGAWLLASGTVSFKKEAASAKLVEQMVAVWEGGAIETHVHGGALYSAVKGGRDAVVAEGVPPSQCMSSAWVLRSRGTVMINGLFSRKLSPTILDDLCARNPDGAELTWYPKAKK